MGGGTVRTFVVYVTDYRDSSFVVEVEGTGIMLQQMSPASDQSDTHLIVAGEGDKILFVTNHYRFAYDKDAMKGLTIVPKDEDE